MDPLPAPSDPPPRKKTHEITLLSEVSVLLFGAAGASLLLTLAAVAHGNVKEWGAVLVFVFFWAGAVCEYLGKRR